MANLVGQIYLCGVIYLELMLQLYFTTTWTLTAATATTTVTKQQHQLHGMFITAAYTKFKQQHTIQYVLYNKMSEEMTRGTKKIIELQWAI